MGGVMPGLPRLGRRIRRLSGVPGDRRLMMCRVLGQSACVPGNQCLPRPLVCLITGRIREDLAGSADDADGTGLRVGIGPGGRHEPASRVAAVDRRRTRPRQRVVRGQLMLTGMARPGEPVRAGPGIACGCQPEGKPTK